VYPGAHHAFDAPGLDRVYFWRRLKWDGPVTADVRSEVRAFLREHLARPLR